jgi:hypothetical protein
MYVCIYVHIYTLVVDLNVLLPEDILYIYIYIYIYICTYTYSSRLKCIPEDMSYKLIDYIQMHVCIYIYICIYIYTYVYIYKHLSEDMKVCK